MPLKSLGVPTSAFDNLFARTGTDAASAAPGPLTPMTASGGTTVTFTQPGGDYKAHYFTASGSFVVSDLGSTGEVDIVVVAGGGGGGAGGPGGSAGGGGAGAVLYESGYTITATGTYPITIGGGGSGGTPGPKLGAGGGTSQFNSPTAAIFAASGGGYGAFGSDNGGDGGCGGGGGRPSGSGGSAVPPGSTYPTDATIYANHGSGPPTQPGYAGGGGGAGEAGGVPGNGAGGNGIQINIVPYTTYEPGDGRVGSPIPSVHGANGYYWGGGGSGPNAGVDGGRGGGGGDQPTSPAYKNGVYGWNEGAKPGDDLASNAGANTGGGGGGAGGNGNDGGNGGAGMVIIRYLE